MFAAGVFRPLLLGEGGTAKPGRVWRGPLTITEGPGQKGISPEGPAAELSANPNIEFLFVFIVDFFELYVYNKVDKNQLRRNLT